MSTGSGIIHGGGTRSAGASNQATTECTGHIGYAISEQHLPTIDDASAIHDVERFADIVVGDQYPDPATFEVLDEIANVADREWVNACKGDLKTCCDFDYSGTMIEQLLLGLVAFRAGKKIDYALYVPTTYKKSAKSPLVVLLHGLSSNPHQVIRYKGVKEEAEKRGYIVVAPYGYNSRGWYGSRGKGKQGAYFGKEGDPDNLGELSEKDVMNVLEIIRKEFSIDDGRIYLSGHSMGGGGTAYLGAKYNHIWAALAPLSPALPPPLTWKFDKLKGIPVLVVTGEKDRIVKVADVRRWVKALEENGVEHVYNEIKGGNHFFTITRNPKMIAEVFDFFDKHKRKKTGADGSAATEE